MKCAYHPESPAFSTCSQCGAWLCGSCAVDINGKFICKRCVANAVNMSPGQNFDHPGHHGHGGAYKGSEFSAERRRPSERTPHRPYRYISGLWILMLSCLPGLNYMAMGLIKRGLFFMSAFFGIIYLMIGYYPMVFLLIILFFASLCDAQNKRRRINNGEFVSDDIYDIIRFFREYKTLILGALAFIMLTSFLGSGGGFWHGHRHGPSFFPLFPLIVVCFIGWYFIKIKRRKSDMDDERHTHRHRDNHSS